MGSDAFCFCGSHGFILKAHVQRFIRKYFGKWGIIMAHYKINYYTYHDYVEKFYFGHALTEEHLNDATTSIAKYIVDGGAKELIESLGVVICERWESDRMISRRFCFSDKQELTFKQIMALGLYLPFGAYYGSEDVFLIR